ncbi:MAG: histidine kinase, partial [Opitutae bacterium]|nr:histidine kinase [Opitutae bacterium]
AACEEVRSLLALSCEKNGFAPELVDGTLRSCPKPVFGGVFPGVVFGGAHYSRGTVMVGLSSPVRVVGVRNIDAEEAGYEETLEREAVFAGGPRSMCFVFVDGMSRRISAFTEALFNAFGPSLNYVGGGAGALSGRKPCLFTPDGMIENAAIVVFTDIPGGVGAAHGWSPVSVPIKVTGSRMNVIDTLNWEPAFEIYRRIVESHSGRSFASNKFFDLAKGYPLGIGRLDAEFVVRDPLMNIGESLVCVGEVPEGSFVSVLHGDAESLLKGAVRAEEIARESFPAKAAPRALFLADCVSRALFLEDDFPRELAALAGPEPLFGALTVGEIANNGREYLEFYNKTAAVAILGE